MYFFFLFVSFIRAIFQISVDVIQKYTFGTGSMDPLLAATLTLNSTLAATAFTSATTAATTATTALAPIVVTSLTHTAAAIRKSYGKSIKNNEFSPVTLAAEWSRMARLLVLACLSVLGSIGNVFMISSVMIEDHLKKAGEH